MAFVSGPQADHVDQSEEKAFASQWAKIAYNAVILALAGVLYC